jgi:nitrate reductase gamma subunit
MGVGNILLLAIIVVAHGVFIARVYRIYQLVNLGQGTLQFNDIGRRIKDVVVKGFGQQPVIREPSGWGHFFIFWGFWIISYGTLESFANGLTPFHFTFEFLGPLYPILNTLLDFFGLFVLIAIAVGVYRRAIIRPVRLQGERSHEVDAYVILGLIVTLVIAFLGMHAIDQEKPGFLLVSDAIRAALLGGEASIEEYPVAYKGLEWVHNLVVLGFLMYIPYSKHIHIVTSLPNFFLRRTRVKGRIDKSGSRKRRSGIFRCRQGHRLYQEETARRDVVHRVRPLPSGVSGVRDRQAVEPEEGGAGHQGTLARRGTGAVQRPERRHPRVALRRHH